jgi:hypothetical protein
MSSVEWASHLALEENCDFFFIVTFTTKMEVTQFQSKGSKDAFPGDKHCLRVKITTAHKHKHKHKKGVG